MSNILLPLLLQTPFGTQNPDANKPIDLSRPFDVIVYIILPILLVIFYFYWQKKQKDEKNKK